MTIAEQWAHLHAPTYGARHLRTGVTDRGRGPSGAVAVGLPRGGLGIVGLRGTCREAASMVKYGDAGVCALDRGRTLSQASVRFACITTATVGSVTRDSCTEGIQLNSKQDGVTFSVVQAVAGIRQMLI